MMQFGEE